MQQHERVLAGEQPVPPDIVVSADGEGAFHHVIAVLHEPMVGVQSEHRIPSAPPRVQERQGLAIVEMPDQRSQGMVRQPDHAVPLPDASGHAFERGSGAHHAFLGCGFHAKSCSRSLTQSMT